MPYLKKFLLASLCTSSDHTKLCASMPDVKIDEIHVAMEKVFINMRKNLEAEGIWPDKLPKRA